MNKSDFQTLEFVKKGKNGETEVVKTFELTPVSIDEFHLPVCRTCAFFHDANICPVFASISYCGESNEAEEITVWKEVKQ